MLNPSAEVKDEMEGKRFKIIVDQGEVFLVTIDAFEEVFEVSRDVVKNMEFIDVLDPFIFENHKSVVNALFLVYYDLSQAYLQKEYYEKREQNDEKYLSVDERATKKLKLTLGLDE
jgi:hypothetical protein